MSGSGSDVATRLFTSLQAVGCEVTAVEIADILWLARYVPAARRGEPRSTSLSISTGPPVPKGELAHGDETGKPSEAPSSSSASIDRESDTAGGLYVEANARLTRGHRASSVRVPGAPALPNALALSRALRPLLKKRVSRHRWQLDEEATAEATALNHGVATPIFRPSAERWFEVALVIDGAPSMHVWHQAAGELRKLLMRHGGFRDLRQYRLRPAGADAGRGAGADARRGADAGAGRGAGEGVAGAAGASAGGDAGPRAEDAVELISQSGHRLKPKAIADPSGRRLIIVLSDAVSTMWRELPLRRALFAWSRWSPVVLVDVLPRRMWPHTAIGFAERAMAPRRAAAPNVEWVVERDWWEAGAGARVGAGAGADGGRGITLPVITLDADQFGRWARALMQVSAERCAGTLLPLEAIPAPLAASSDMSRDTTGASPTGASAASAPMTAMERVQHFRSVASAPAYQLACYFAATLPVLPVLRIVQRQMMPETGPGHLAEFLLSGLVTAKSAEDDNNNAARVEPERLVYEFYPGVQDLLLAQLDATEVSRIMPAIEAYLEAHFGKSYELSALIPDDRGAEKISAEALPFVKPAFDLMQRILGRRPRARTSEYDRLVNILRRAFPEQDIDANLPDQGALSDEELRSHLIAVAIELMYDDTREALLPFAVTAPSPSLPPRLWGTLVGARKMFTPLNLMDGVKWGEDQSLEITSEVREALLQRVPPSRLPAMHQRIIEAYRVFADKPGDNLDLPPFADAYFYRHFLTHVAAAGNDDLARAIVSSPEWIEGKLRVCGFADLLADLARFSHIPAIRALRAIAMRRGDKEHGQESTQGWAESLIEEWSSTLSDADRRTGASAETPTEAPAETMAQWAEANGATGSTTALEPDAPPNVWVLVAGTGTRALSKFERDVTIALGARLAQDGHGLICGAWPGIDILIEESYRKEIGRLGRILENKLICLAPAGRADEFGPGPAEDLSYDSGGQFFVRGLERADAVVLIGGEGLTLKVGHVAHSHFVPVIPVAATGGDAASLFAELVHEEIYRPDDPLNAAVLSDRNLRRLVERIAALVRDAEPSRHVVALAEHYTLTSDRARCERIETRLLMLLRRGVRANVDLVLSQSLRNPPATACLGAFVCRVTPSSAQTPGFFEPYDSPHVVLQRVRACEVAFETQAMRYSLPSDAEQRLSRLYSTLDENRDDITRQAKQFMAGRLMPLARLVTLAEQASSPRFDDLRSLRLTASAMVRQDMALDCLSDPHPGWRLIGLAAFTGAPLHVPPLPDGIVSRVLQATRFEATFLTHLQLAVEAIDLMTPILLPITLDDSERAALERIREHVRSAPR